MKKVYFLKKREVFGSVWLAGFSLFCAFTLFHPLSTVAKMDLSFQQMSEAEYWSAVMKENSLDGYQRYMLEFPDGKHYDEAVEKVVVLRDENAWQNALAENTPASFSRYLKIYPRGIHVNDARKKLNLGEPIKVATNTNTRGTATERPSTPVKPSNTATKEEKKPATPQVTEKSVWDQAVASANPDLFKQYIEDFPSGRYRSEAIERIPMEFSLTRSDSVDSLFFLTVRFAKKPVNIVAAEMPNKGLSYLPDNPGSDGKSDNNLRRRRVGEETRYFFWPEGNVTAFISDEDELSTEMVINVGSKDKYQLELEDDSGDSWKIELESSLPSLELLGVVGVDGTMDTAFFTLKGGIPDYYVRIVKKGKDVNDYIHEAQLFKDKAEFTWYLDKGYLVNNGIVPSGNYEVYVLDSRKLEHIKYIRPLTIGSGLLVSNMNIYTYLLIPVILLIIWMFLNWSKKSKYPYQTRRDDFRY